MCKQDAARTWGDEAGRGSVICVAGSGKGSHGHGRGARFRYGMISLVAHIAECNAAASRPSAPPRQHVRPHHHLLLVSTAALHRPHSSTMASLQGKKDMRRADLIVPYTEPANKSDDNMSSTMASTLPMAAMFTRNKVAVVFSVQSWLAETPDQKKKSTTPAYFSVGMALMSLLVSYSSLILPPPPGSVGTGTGTQAAPAAAPPS
ncbi:hypothetical protein OPT61_g10347 [Boeremia exigua]|uniref:Uncharacterized protein n=1 Tax=Boeremia exigua TaxID=749465 RepID=A0ACC2HQ44_9PLEO|nr:hypothetical protein OPT61_g10347 [Boeremia exigua]